VNLRRPRHHIYLACGVPALAAYHFLGVVGQCVVYGVIGLSAAVLAALAAKRAVGRQRWLWTLLAVGLALFSAADSLSSWYQATSGELPFPSAADALYFAGYCCYVAGLIVVGLRRRALWKAQMLDSALVALAAAYCSWLFLIEPSSTGFDLSSLSATSYPVMDTILLTLLLWLVLGGLAPRGSGCWLLASFVFLGVTDVAYAEVQLYSTYSTTSSLDFGWLLSYLCWGAAALHPSAREALADLGATYERRALKVVAPAVAFLVVPLSIVLQVLIYGRTHPFDTAVGGAVLGLFAAARVVHLVRSENAYREKAERSELHFRSLIENSADVFTIANADATITYSSPSVVGLLGYEPDELAGSVALRLIHPDDVAETERKLAVLLDGEHDVVSAELRMRHKDGTWVPVEAVATNRLDDPAVHGIVVCTRDVREREAATAERRRLEQELHQAQKMDAIGRLAGGIAHDFNNLLMVIAASTESLMLELPPEQDAIGVKLRQTETAVVRAAALTHQLLTFSRRQQPAFRVINLNEQVESTCGMLRRIIGEEIRIELELDPTSPQVRADAGQIDQVLFNLAVNARDAMPDGGTLSFATRREGENVTLEVRDTGAGMDDETQGRLFEPFFTTKAPGEGTGLGLATVYGIVSGSGGTVHVDSAVGVGTAFTIVLPTADESPALAISESPSKPATGGETVLLVEDEEIVRAVVREGLEQYGYRVFDTGDPREAEGLARLHRADLLVTDIRMPHMNGFELFDQLRALHPGLRTVFMSGYSEAAYTSMDGDGTTSFLQKPFGIGDLAQRVRTLLDGVDGALTASAA
jgi:PAS domain S-box-containing protein